MAGLVGERLELKAKENWKDTREGITPFNKLDWDARQKLIEKDPAYARMVCRCETVTEGQIVKALHSPIPVYTIDGVKRRCRAGMGRCQGSFCTPRVMDIIARESGIPFAEVSKNGADAKLITGTLKGGAAE